MNDFLEFLSGALICNSLPHIARGLQGERFYTPWSRPRGEGMSSPLENFLWGSCNLGIGLLVLFAGLGIAFDRSMIVSGAGFVAAGIGLSTLFGRRKARTVDR